jgi:hypothetical protein
MTVLVVFFLNGSWRHRAENDVGENRSALTPVIVEAPGARTCRLRRPAPVGHL